jgi:hypothetical protein
MKNRLQQLSVALALLALFNFYLQPATANAQGTAFTYQGRLQNNGLPANGSYNLQFALYTNATSGTIVAGPITNSAVAVTNGLFTVTLDFGSGSWNGQSNWLQIAVETNSTGAMFTSLTPRQPITSVPYAIYAESGGTATALASGTALGSSSENSIASGVSDAFIGGGSGNVIQTNADYTFIGGGLGNTASGGAATVGGGSEDAATGSNATVGGGWRNAAGNYSATVAGGSRQCRQRLYCDSRWWPE